MNWKDYENEIHNIFKEQYPNSEISYNTKINGRYSKIDRQIDLLIEDFVAGNRIKIIVDGKYFNKKIDVKEVEKFIGMLNDCNVHKGLLITQKGYSKSAINRAHYDPADIELDILNFKELHKFQAFGALPYSGNYAALIPAPFGWVIDAKQYGFALATIYQRGLDLKKAQSNNEWMYVNIWNKDDQNASNLKELLEWQNNRIKNSFPDAEISYLPTVKRDKYGTSLRKSIISKYPVPEYTGFVEFDEFIFFCTLFTPSELESKNIKKLEYILTKALPLDIVRGK